MNDGTLMAHVGDHATVVATLSEAPLAKNSHIVWMLATAVAFSCTSDDGEKSSSEDETTTGTTDSTGTTDTAADVLPGVPALGNQGATPVSIEHMASSDDGLRQPRDLAFDPEVEGLLWVVNKRDDSVVHIYNAGTAEQTTDKVYDPYGLHFLDAPSSIDFGAPGTFGTCQESMNTYNGTARPNEFMGPTLWPAALDVFGTSNPEAVEYLTELFGMPVDLGSHLDMLHESPLCMGIAWEKDNVYWVVDGYHNAIVRYDFVEDHGVGYDDHSDGIMYVHMEGEIGYEEDVPAHLELDPASRLLYIADPANERVLVMNVDSGTNDGRFGPVQEPGTTYERFVGTEWSVFLDGATAGFTKVSGLELVGDYVVISDNASGEIIAFDKSGNEVDRLSTGLEAGALMGMAVRSDSEIWFTDAVNADVYRVKVDE